jgi:hypothetical protein
MKCSIKKFLLLLTLLAYGLGISLIGILLSNGVVILPLAEDSKEFILIILSSIVAYDVAVIAFVPGLAGQHLDFLQQKFGFIKNNPPELIRNISQGIQDILGFHVISLGLSLIGLLLYACILPDAIHSFVLVLFVLFFIFRLHEIYEFTRKQEELKDSNLLNNQISKLIESFELAKENNRLLD